MFYSLLLAIGLVNSVVHSLPSDQLSSHGPSVDKYVVGALPGVTFPTPRSWAGEIPIGSGYGNDTLFFWLWQAESQNADENLIIWLNGGPGCSSLLGIFKEHGPIIFPGDSTAPKANTYSWTRIANVLYVDQPVGTGFSRGDHPATDNTEDTAAFVQWLGNFFKKFPALKSKNIHLFGESYAGIFIPYIAQAIRRRSDLGIKIKSIGLGDATFGNGAAMTNVVGTSYIKQHLGNYGTKMPQSILSVLSQADVDCGFTALLNQVTYPPKNKYYIPGNPSNANYRRGTTPPGYNESLCDFNGGTRTAEQMRFLINGTSCYGSCATYDAAENYFYGVPGRCFNVYNIDTECDDPLYADDAWVAFLNLPDVQKAIHVSPVMRYTECNVELFQKLAAPELRSVPPAYFILPELLGSGILVSLWAGTLDYLINPLGIELSIQNMTWSGAQGFRQKPTTRWYAVNKQFAGTYGVERGLGYFLIEGAGHRTAQDQPASAFTLVQHLVNGKVLRQGRQTY